MTADAPAVEDLIAQRVRLSPRNHMRAVSTRAISAGAATTVLTVFDSAGHVRFRSDVGDLLHAAAEWCPTQNMLAYAAADVSGTPQVRLVRFADDTPATSSSPLTDLPLGVDPSTIDWAPDGTKLIVAARHGVGRTADSVYRVSRRIWRFDGLGIIDQNLSDICQIDTEGVLTWLDVSRSGIVSQPRWSPDGALISYLVSFEATDTATPCPSLRQWSLATSSSREVLSTEWGWIVNTRWLPDSDQVLMLGAPTATGGVFATRKSLWIVGPDQPLINLSGWLAGGAGSSMQPDLPIDWATAASNVILLSDGHTAVFTAEAAGRTYITDVDVHTGRSSGRLIAADDASYALLALNEVNDGGVELHLLECAIDLPPKLTTIAINPRGEHTPSVRPHPRPITVQRHSVPTADGESLDAWVALPAGEFSAPYPTVLKIHGGPYGSLGEIYSEDVDVLASSGYAVVMHNFRGSYGYGDERAASITPDWGSIGELDHHAVLDHLVSLGLVDARRLGVMGHSHGGFATCWLIGRSNRFTAAIAQDPVTNFHDSIRSSDIGPWHFGREFGAALSDPPDALLRRSPITYAHHCRTPLLLIQGEEDSRCPPGQSDQMYTALWETGCRVEMLRLPRADHMGSVYGSHGYRKARIDAVSDWFNQHLQPSAIDRTEGSGDDRNIQAQL